MRDVSYPFRLISSESTGVSHTAAIEAEGLSLYQRTAALVCAPGTPKKTMDVLVAKAWGNIAVWRARACRLREAGCFSAAAIRQIQIEFERFMEAEGKRLAHERAIETLKRAPAASPTIQLGVAEYASLMARIESLEAALRR